MNPPRLPNPLTSHARRAAALAFFAYVLAVRTDDIASSFLLLGEQTRDWTVALGSWRDLPLTGTPSTSGGRGFGPVYYWVLWVGRHIFGPFTDHLPHAGGLTVSVLQAIGDLCLLVALARRLSYPLALAAALLVATGPFDVGLSAAIWNPPVATALVKMAMALALTGAAPASLRRVAGITAFAWLAVQAHGSAFFVAAPVLAALAAQPALLGRWRRAIQVAGASGGVILLLQVPYLVAQIRAPEPRIGPAVVIDSLAGASAVRPAAAFARVSDITGWLIMHTPDAWSYALATLAAAFVAAWRARRDPVLLSVSVAPLLTATALFAAWTRPYDSYWFMTLAPAMVVTYAVAVEHGLRLMARGVRRDTAGSESVSSTRSVADRSASSLARVAAGVASTALLAAVVILQPSRIQASKTFFRYPAYRALVDGSRAVVRRTAVVRDLRVDFPVHETTDVRYLYRVLGGRVAPDGEFIAVIHADGTVTFVPAS